MNRLSEATSLPSATLGEAIGELPVLVLIVVMANVAAATMVARHTYDFVTGGDEDRR